MLRLDSSFQNSRPQRTGSLANLASSNTSPRSSKSAQKSRLSSKSIERGTKPQSSTKKPTQNYNLAAKSTLSPLLVSKAQNHRKDLESEIQKGLEAMKKSKSNASKSTSKPLSSRPVSSNTSISTNYGFSELRRTNLEKLNESIDFQSQSISEMTENGLTQSRDNRKGSQLNCRGPEMRTGGSDQVSVSSKSGKNSLDSSLCGPVTKKSRNNENLYKVQGIQNVYAVKSKPLSLTNVLRTTSRSRNGEDEKGLSKRNGSRSASKENNPGSVQKVSAKKDNGKKGLTGNSVKKADLISCQSLLAGLKDGENVGNGCGEQEKEKMTEGDEMGSEEYRYLESQCVRKEGNLEGNGGLGFLGSQLKLFCEKIQGVTDEVVHREKRKFFIRLLEILHQYKLQLAQMWREQDGNVIITENTEEQDEEDEKDLEEINMRSAAIFYNHKILQKYFYQGLLGYYVLCKMGDELATPQQEEEPAPPPAPKSRQGSIASTRKSSQASIQGNKKNEHPYTADTKSQPLRSKSPISSNKTPNKEPAQAKKATNNSIKKPNNASNQSFRVAYSSLSPNQSFAGPSRDKSTGKMQNSRSLTRKSSCKDSRILGDISRLDCSFGQSSVRRSSERFVRGYETGQSNVSRTKKGLNNNEDLVPDQILTEIPKPITKEGLASFDTPRMEDRRFTIDFVSHGNNTSQVKGRNEERKNSQGPCKSDFKVKETDRRAYNSRESIASTSKKRYEGNREDGYKSSYNNYNTKTRKVELEEENEELAAIKLVKALEFRKAKLLNTYARPFLNKLVELVNNKLEAVWYLRIRGLLRRGFMGFYVNAHKSSEPTGATDATIHEEDGEESGIKIMQTEYDSEEEESDVEDKMKSAQEYYEMNMKINIFNAFLEHFVKSHEENRTYEIYRENYLMRSCFVKWFERMPELKREREELRAKEQRKEEEEDDGYGGVADKFRSIILTEKAMRGLKKYVKESREALSPLESVPKEESPPEKLV